jgi:putative ABC transport system permease protein
MILAKLGWRETRNRPGRATLTLLSVVIGVAAVVAVTFTTRSTKRAFNDIFDSIAGRAALEVTARGGGAISEQILAELDGVPGVQVASPMLKRLTNLYVAMPAEQPGKETDATTQAGKPPSRRKIQLVALGIDPERDKAVHDYEIQSGQPLSQANGIMLGRDFAESIGVKVNDEVSLLTRSGFKKTHVVALYTIHGTAVTTQGATLVMPLRLAQSWFKAPRQLDSIQIVLKPDANEADVSAEIAKRLPANATVGKPAGRSAIAEETALATDQALQMARAVCLLLAVFVIANTFLMSVTQRRRQFGIMRAVGATRKQIARLVLGQAFMLGLAGTAIGAALGVLVANYLTVGMGALYQTTLPPIELTVMPFVWAVVFGLGISFLGAAMPTWKATHLAPLDSMRDVLPEEMEGFWRILPWIGLVLVIGGGGVMAAAILGVLPISYSVSSGMLMLVGLSLMLPLGLKALSRVVAWIMPRGLRVESRLASRNLITHRARTTLTVAVVFLGAAAFIAFSWMVIDNINDVRNWYHKTIIADFLIRAASLDMSSGMSADLPDELNEKIREIPGIRSVDGIGFVSMEANGQTVMLIMRSFDKPEVQSFDLVNADLDATRQALLEGQVVAGSVFAERAKLKAGDEVTLHTSDGEKKFRLAAVANDYLAAGLTLYMDRAIAERELNIGGVNTYVIKADHARIDEVRTALEDVIEPYGLVLNSFSDIQQQIDKMMAGVDAGLWALVALGLLVVTFGVANTLTMSVLEQTFELGLLRIVAMTRNQVRKLIFSQALIIALLALIPAVASGIGLAYLIHLATMTVIGHPVPYVFHPYLLIGGFVGGVIVVLLSAWSPAERAARIELPTTLKLR